MSTIEKSARFYVEQYGIPESHAKNMALFIDRFEGSGAIKIKGIDYYELPKVMEKRWKNLNRCKLRLSLWTQSLKDERSVLSATYCPRWNDIYMDLLFSDHSCEMKLSDFINSHDFGLMGAKTRERLKDVARCLYG